METKPYQRVWLEEAAPGETFIYKEGKAEREDVQNADIILGNVSPKLISTGDKLKWLQTNSAGVDGVYPRLSAEGDRFNECNGRVWPCDFGIHGRGVA